MTESRKCRYCGTELPPKHPGRGGHNRQFCNDVCRVMKAYRNRNGVTSNRQRLERMLGRPYVGRELSEPERAWLAAMIDGEGSISLVRSVKRKNTNRRYVAPIVTVNNTNVAIINRTKEIVGEQFCRVQLRDRGHINCKTLMTLKIDRIATADILEQVRPYLVAKGRQADLVIEYCRTHDGLPSKTAPLDRFYEMQRECESLNRRGTDVPVGAT